MLIFVQVSAVSHGLKMMLVVVFVGLAVFAEFCHFFKK